MDQYGKCPFETPNSRKNSEIVFDLLIFPEKCVIVNVLYYTRAAAVSRDSCEEGKDNERTATG